MTVRTMGYCSLFCCLLPLTAHTWASQLIRRTLPELVAGADLIFVGRCEAVASEWNEDHSLIFTAYRFRVARALKGVPGTTVTLRELGGRIENVGMEVPGVPSYSVGEEALLCVHRTELGRWETFGATQGKFRVTRDGEGRPWVESDVYPAELAALVPSEQPASARHRRGAPLAAFAARLRTAARTEGNRP